MENLLFEERENIHFEIKSYRPDESVMADNNKTLTLKNK